MSRIDTVAIKDGEGYRMINANQFDPEQHEKFEGEIAPIGFGVSDAALAASMAANEVISPELIQLQEKLAFTEDQLATLKGEFISFQNDVDAMQARIAELQGDTIPVGATNENPNVDGAQDNAVNEDVPNESWTIERIKAYLSEKEIGYKASAQKPELLALVPKV